MDTGAVKTSLKELIRRKRQDRGLGDLTVDFSPKPSQPMTEAELYKELRRKLSNRRSAKRSRLKVKEQEDKYKKLLNEETAKKERLLTIVKSLEHMKQKQITELENNGVTLENIETVLNLKRSNEHAHNVKKTNTRRQKSNLLITNSISNREKLSSNVGTCSATQNNLNNLNVAGENTVQSVSSDSSNSTTSGVSSVESQNIVSRYVKHSEIRCSDSQPTIYMYPVPNLITRTTEETACMQQHSSWTGYHQYAPDISHPLTNGNCFDNFQTVANTAQIPETHHCHSSGQEKHRGITNLPVNRHHERRFGEESFGTDRVFPATKHCPPSTEEHHRGITNSPGNGYQERRIGEESFETHRVFPATQHCHPRVEEQHRVISNSPGNGYQEMRVDKESFGTHRVFSATQHCHPSVEEQHRDISNSPGNGYQEMRVDKESFGTHRVFSATQHCPPSTEEQHRCVTISPGNYHQEMRVDKESFGTHRVFPTKQQCPMSVEEQHRCVSISPGNDHKEMRVDRESVGTHRVVPAKQNGCSALPEKVDDSRMEEECGLADIFKHILVANDCLKDNIDILRDMDFDSLSSISPESVADIIDGEDSM